MGISQANGFKTHNELTMYPLGNYPLAPSENNHLLEERGVEGILCLATLGKNILVRYNHDGEGDLRRGCDWNRGRGRSGKGV